MSCDLGIVLLALLAFGASGSGTPAAAQAASQGRVSGLSPDPSAEALLDAVDKALFLESYASKVKMETIEPGSPARAMAFTGLARRDKGTYMEVTAPERTKGARFLQLEGSLWMYNPKSGSAKALRLSGVDSFQGSAFSNADVGKSQFSDDYAPVLEPDAVLEHPELGSVSCKVIESRAKTNRAAYGRIVMWLRASDSMPLRMEYYAKSGLLFKRMELSSIRDFGTITRPSVMRMESFDKKGTFTVMTIESIEKREVGASVFSKSYLTR